jgi:hypothetical protein
MGPYCRYCDTRCFVLRRLPDDAHWRPGLDVLMATCLTGMAHDRERIGYDHTTAINPHAAPYLADPEPGDVQEKLRRALRAFVGRDELPQPIEIAVDQSGGEWTVHMIYNDHVVRRITLSHPRDAAVVAWALIAAIPGVKCDVRVLPEES